MSGGDVAPLFLHHLQLVKWIIYDRRYNFSCDIPSIFVCKIKEFMHEKVYDHHSRKVFHLLMDYTTMLGYQDIYGTQNLYMDSS